MKYLEAVNIVKEVENKYNVMSIKFKGISIWPMLRTYIFIEKTEEETPFKLSTKNILAVLKGLFAYNPLTLLKKHNTWVFTSVRERKNVNGIMISRVAGGAMELDKTSLLWESSTPQISNLKKKEIEEKNIISGSVMLFPIYALKFLFKFWKPKIENENVLLDIIKDYNYNFNYCSYIRKLYMQKVIMDFFLVFFHNPKKSIVVCAYSYFGIIWSFKNHHIPVIEFQHGVLNNKHYAYNPSFYSPELYPDSMCVFGEFEFDYFTRQCINYSKIIKKLGLYMLDFANNFFNEDIFLQYRKNYNAIIIISGQYPQEYLMQDFFDKVARRKPEYLFFYIPRDPNVVQHCFSKNILFCKGVNIYEYLKWCDLHCTISSTTCLEAQYFHKGTLFWNYENLGFQYYGNKLKSDNGVSFVETVDQAIVSLDRLINSDFHYLDFFYGNYKENLNIIMK